MKKGILFLLVLFVLGIIAVVISLNTKSVTFAPLPNGRVRMSQISSQEEILKSGDRLVERGLCDEAIKKYDEALEPKYVNEALDNAGPLFRKVRLFRLLQQYNEALTQLEIFLKLSNSSTKPEIYAELEALSLSKQRNSNQPVFEYIDHLKQKYENSLPPKDYDSFSPIPIADIILLYDTIRDYDAGIAYVDMILDWTYETDNEFKDLKGKITNTKQAEQCMEVNKPANERHPDWRACKWIREYLKVREAFEREKANGGPTCGEWGAKDESGKYCVGDATQALIQSDYFPW